LEIINIQQEKTQISSRTPGHWRNRKAIETMPLNSKMSFVTVQFQLVVCVVLNMYGKGSC